MQQVKAQEQDEVWRGKVRGGGVWEAQASGQRCEGHRMVIRVLAKR